MMHFHHNIREGLFFSSFNTINFKDTSTHAFTQNNLIYVPYIPQITIFRHINTQYNYYKTQTFI